MAADVTDKSPSSVNELHKRIHVGLAPVASYWTSWAMIHSMNLNLNDNKTIVKEKYQQEFF